MADERSLSRNGEVDADKLLQSGAAMAAEAWLREWNTHPENAMKWNMTVHAAWVAPIFEQLLRALASETQRLDTQLARENYEPPEGWQLKCEKCGADITGPCGWPSDCPTGLGKHWLGR